MSNYNLEQQDGSESSDVGISHLRPTPLYGVFVCAIIIIIVAVILIIKNEVASGYLRTNKVGTITGPIAFILGILLGVFPLYYLVKMRRRHSKRV